MDRLVCLTDGLFYLTDSAIYLTDNGFYLTSRLFRMASSKRKVHVNGKQFAARPIKSISSIKKPPGAKSWRFCCCFIEDSS